MGHTAPRVARGSRDAASRVRAAGRRGDRPARARPGPNPRPRPRRLARRAPQPRRSARARLPPREGAHDTGRVPVEPQCDSSRPATRPRTGRRSCTTASRRSRPRSTSCASGASCAAVSIPGAGSSSTATCSTRRSRSDRRSWRSCACCCCAGRRPRASSKSRTERLHPFRDLVGVNDGLDRLAGRDEPLARRLPREPGQKEARVRELLTEAGGEVTAAVPEDAPVEWKPRPGERGGERRTGRATGRRRRARGPGHGVRGRSRRAADGARSSPRQPRGVGSLRAVEYVVYHNPSCSKSRGALEILRRAGHRDRCRRVPQGAARPRHARADRRRDPEPAGRAGAQGQEVQGAGARRERLHDS